MREHQRCGRRNGLIGFASILNGHVVQFYKAVHRKVTRQSKTEVRVGIKKDNLELNGIRTDKFSCSLVLDVLKRFE